MTQTTNNEGHAGMFQSVNINLTMKGWLAHSNNLFDRTCPGCRGMYSSYQTAVCPKCGAQLTYITDKKGRPMAISEGSFYPCLSNNQKESDLKKTQEKKNGIEAVYRFKMFSFADSNGVLAPAQAHSFCHKGALVEIRIINHQPIYSLFTTNDGVPKVEILLLVYENYGDYVKLLKGPKVAETTIAYTVNADGTPAQVSPPFPAQNNNQDTNQLISNLAEQVARLTAQLNANTNQPQPKANCAVETTAGSGEIDPFIGAM